MAHLYRLIAYGVLAVAASWLALAPLKAHAAIPATVVEAGCTSSCFNWQFRSDPPQKSAALACQGGLGEGQNSGYGWATYTAVVAVYDYGCDFTASYSGGSFTTSTQALVKTSVLPYPPVYSCPANSTLSGSSCTCNAGFIEEGSVCVDAVAAACSALSGQVAYIQVPGRQLPGTTVCASTGCSMTMSGTVIVAKADGATVTEGDASFSGATCTPESASQAAPDPCVKGYPGQVNGVDVCVPYAPGSEVETVKSSTSTTTPSGGGDATTTSTSTSTVCGSNSCNTTTTVTTTVGGGAPTTTTTETEQPRDDYCAANPRSPECAESTFTGSCDSGFACQGDAVQCATARELHRVSCTLHTVTPEAALYAAGSQFEAGPADIPSTTVNIGPGALDSSNALGASACISDLALTVAGTAVTLPLSNICPYLAHLRLMLLAVAWLMAFRIVARG